MKQRATATLSFASFVLLLLFLVLAATAYLSGGKVQDDSKLISEDAIPGSIEAHAMRMALTGGMRCVALALVAESDDARLDDLQQAHDTDAPFQKAMDDYRATMEINPKRDHALLEELTLRFADFTRKRQAFVIRINEHDQAGAKALFEHEVLPSFTLASRAADDLVAYNHANAIRFAQSIAANVRTLRLTVIIVLGLALIFGGLLVANLAVRRAAQDELRENERRLRLTLDHVFASVVLCEPDGKVIEANQAALTAARRLREEVTGKPFSASHWWPGIAEMQPKLQQALRDAAAGKTTRLDLEDDQAGALDQARTIDFGCGPIRAPGGQVVHLVVSWIDISDRKRLEQQLLRAQRMEAIGALSSGLAHDLNNILAPMVMAGGLLKMKLTTPRDQQMITMIENGAQRGADIIRQMLRFGRGTDGAKTSLELRYVIKEIVHIIQETFPRNVSLTHTAATDLWPIVGDTTQLHQMLLNLCVNARDAMPRGGRLSIAAVNFDLAETEARTRFQAAPGRYVQLTVTDTGEGIPKAIIDRIFDPFFTTKAPGKGTGLGLSSVLGIAKGHGGFLTVESEPGKGSTFSIYLPAAEHGETVRAEAVAADLPHGRGELILLVDDEVAMRESTRDILEMHNYQIITAGDGDEALKQFMANRDAVKLVLTDLDMPIMNGVELIRSLQVLDRGVKFVVMTGSMTEEKRDELTAFVPNEILAKPCDPARLLRTLRQML